MPLNSKGLQGCMKRLWEPVDLRKELACVPRPWDTHFDVVQDGTDGQKFRCFDGDAPYVEEEVHLATV